jgi:hypothetical protein
MSTESRIATLEAQVAAAQIELAELKAGKAARPVLQPQPVRDEGVRIVQLVEPSNFVRPTTKELRQLYDVVLAKYPQLRPHLSARWEDQERKESFDGFIWSFERLGFVGRSAVPDTKHYVNFWISDCQDWLRQFRPSHSGNTGAGFLAAVIAHGDIQFTVGDENEGIVWSIGVTTFGGAKASDAWKRVLDGKLMAPTPAERRFAPPSPAQVFGGR